MSVEWETPAAGLAGTLLCAVAALLLLLSAAYMFVVDAEVGVGVTVLLAAVGLLPTALTLRGRVP